MRPLDIALIVSVTALMLIPVVYFGMVDYEAHAARRTDDRQCVTTRDDGLWTPEAGSAAESLSDFCDRVTRERTKNGALLGEP
jgi:hypothetical protein